MRVWLVLALLTASCGRGGGEQAMNAPTSLEVANIEDAEPAGLVADAKAAPEALPQISYSYTYGYRLDTGGIAAVQRRHVALCDSLGPARCRIVTMSRESGAGQFVNASLSLLVDARLARTFGERLDRAVTGAGGAVDSRGIEAEDLSKQIVDTAARVRGKETLSERLLLLLQNRSGKVGELVEAERAYADAQEELDSARSWLAQMRQRVALSKIDIRYASTAPEGGGAFQPIRDSLATSGQTFGQSLGALIRLALMLLPWVLVVGALVFIARKLGWRRRVGLKWPRRARGRGAPENESGIATGVIVD